MDAALAASLSRQFRATGWEVMAAASAEEVEHLCLANRPDVLLLDVALGGPELIARIHRAADGVLIAAMSLDLTASVRVDSLAAGAFVCISKPLRLATIMALKKVVLGRSAAPRVLISDDDALMVRSLERAARNEGLDPVGETDASHVLGLAKEVVPQVIVLDINQRDFDGRDVLAQLKRDPATRDIRVVMLTGVEDQLTRHDCLILGADDYVVKPLDPLFFVRIARKLTERSQPLN
jgi:DNA-binding response OmpR family regulator